MTWTMSSSYKLDDMEPYTKSVDVLSWFSEDDMGEFTESEVFTHQKLVGTSSYSYFLFLIQHKNLVPYG